MHGLLESCFRSRRFHFVGKRRVCLLIPVCQKDGVSRRQTHTQGKDPDSGLYLHWKAEASKNIRGEVACNFCDTVVIFQCQIWWMSFAGAASCHFGRGRPSDHFPRIQKCAVWRRQFAHFRRLQTRRVKKCGRVAPDLSSVSSMGFHGAPQWLIGARRGLPANQPACQHASS